MKLKILFGVAGILILVGRSNAQDYETNNVSVQTFAGSAFSGYVDGTGQQTMFNSPIAVVADSSGNLFVLDAKNYRVRKITPGGTVTTFAGGGTESTGYGTNVTLVPRVGISPSYGAFGSMTIDHSNGLWITISYSRDSMLFFQIRPDSYVEKITWSQLPVIGPGIEVQGSCVDSANNVYFSTRVAINGHPGNKIFRLRTDGSVELFAGSGNRGAVDGNGAFSSLDDPTALAADSADNIYVWDSGNYLIRRISKNREVFTIAGDGSGRGAAASDVVPIDGVGRSASFGFVTAMCSDTEGNIILSCGSSIRKMSPSGKVTTIAGSFRESGYADGPGRLSRFDYASGVSVSQGMVFVADNNNERIRKITFTPTARPVSPATLQLSMHAGLNITGTTGRTYQIQSSADMTNWTLRTMLSLTSSPYLWIDQNPMSGSKFYRALPVP